VAATPAEREAVFRLRYSAWQEGREGKWPTRHAGQRSDPLDEHATLLYVRAGEEIVATARLAWGSAPAALAEVPAGFGIAGPPPPFAASALLSEMVIAPPWRLSRVTKCLCRGIYAALLERGARLCFTETPPALVPFTEALGFVRYKEAPQPPVDREV